jgi:hypothetical protein
LHIELVKESSTMSRTRTQEDLLATARKGQEIMADAIRTWVETVRTAAPRLSTIYAPLATQLPRAQAAVASAYDLAERMLAGQRKFAEDVVKATRPLMPGLGVSQPEDHREPTPQEPVAATAAQAAAPKPAASKPAATKSTAKTTATARAPKSTAASRSPKTTTSTAKRAPRNSTAG